MQISMLKMLPTFKKGRKSGASEKNPNPPNLTNQIMNSLILMFVMHRNVRKDVLGCSIHILGPSMHENIAKYQLKLHHEFLSKVKFCLYLLLVIKNIWHAFQKKRNYYSQMLLLYYYSDRCHHTTSFVVGSKVEKQGYQRP